MKVTIVVEADGGGEPARRINVVDVPQRVLKLFEVMGGDIAESVADDVMTNALKAVMVAKPPEEAMASAPAKDEHGRPTGRSMMEETLGLNLIEHMAKGR
jgi:hypothetical protein